MLISEYEQTSLITNIKEEIVDMRAAIGKIDNSLLFPMPFQYYHIVNFCMKIELVLLAYAFLFINGGKGSLWSCFAFPLVTFLLLGLVEVHGWKAFIALYNSICSGCKWYVGSLW